jgi:signal transduction histidine kinase
MTEQHPPHRSSLNGVSSLHSLPSFLGHQQPADALLNGVCQDSDQLKRTADELAQLAEYLNQVSSARSQFLSKVAHELRTPLTIAKGWIGMLRYGELLPQQERIVKVIDQQIEELTRLVNDLLDLSRRDAGTLELRLETVDVVALVRHVAEHQRELTSLHGIQLVIQARSEPIYVCVDRGRLAQVLHNLIANACRYVPHYSVGRIDLMAALNGTVVQLTVCDNGIGMAPEHVPQIFEPFYQIEGRERGKSGLGLAIANELVRAHGGSITVESTLGKGTSFHIWLRSVHAPGESQHERRRQICE